MSRKPKEPVFDDDNPEWTREDFAESEASRRSFAAQIAGSVQGDTRPPEGGHEGCRVDPAQPRGHFALQGQGAGLAVADRRRPAQDRQESRLTAPSVLYQPALHHRGLNERGEQRMRLERARFQFGMELHPDEPGMILIFDDFRQHAVGRQARKTQAMLFQPVLVGGVDLVAVAVTFGNLGGAAINLATPGCRA